MKTVSLLLSLLCVTGVGTRASAGTNDPPKLTSYNIDVSKITVSGLSSGGFFAVQFQSPTQK